MSSITILTNGPQARSGQSDALDVSSFSTLRLDLRLTANHGVQPYITTYIESGPTASGPWTVIDENSYKVGSFPGKARITLAGFDNFVRLRWAGGCSGDTPNRSYGPPYGPGGGTLISETYTFNPEFVIGLNGDAKPDAA